MISPCGPREETGWSKSIKLECPKGADQKPNTAPPSAASSAKPNNATDSSNVTTAPARQDTQKAASKSDDFADRLTKAKKRNSDDEARVKKNAERADRDLHNMVAEEKAKKEAEKARERQKQLDRARIDRDMARQRKWHCFGDHNNVSEGYADCRDACRQFYSGQHCKDTCYASGEGSFAHGRSCFKEP